MNKISKIYISSSNGAATNKFNAQRFELPHVYQDVIGMEVTGWSFENNICPTFFPYNSNFPLVRGDDYVDFSLTSISINGGFPKTYAFRWTPKAYLFSRTDVPTKSYTDDLEKMLNQTIKGDVDYDDNVDFIVERDKFERTNIIIVGKNALSGQEIKLKFLFSSGANAADSAYLQMGFDAADYESVMDIHFSNRLISPESTKLSPRKFVDVYIKESPNELVRRIYSSKAYEGIGDDIIVVGDERVRIFEPIKRLRFLTVTLLLPTNLPPYQTGSYELEITLYHQSMASSTFKIDEFTKL